MCVYPNDLVSPINEVFFISALRQISGCHAGIDQDVQEGSLQDALNFCLEYGDLGCRWPAGLSLP